MILPLGLDLPGWASWILLACICIWIILKLRASARLRRIRHCPRCGTAFRGGTIQLESGEEGVQVGYATCSACGATWRPGLKPGDLGITSEKCACGGWMRTLDYCTSQCITCGKIKRTTGFL